MTQYCSLLWFLKFSFMSFSALKAHDVIHFRGMYLIDFYFWCIDIFCEPNSYLLSIDFYRHLATGIFKPLKLSNFWKFLIQFGHWHNFCDLQLIRFKIFALFHELALADQPGALWGCSSHIILGENMNSHRFSGIHDFARGSVAILHSRCALRVDFCDWLIDAFFLFSLNARTRIKNTEREREREVFSCWCDRLIV